MESIIVNLPVVISNTQVNSDNKITSGFIHANTDSIYLNHLKKDCIIPNFSKDNETTIAHQEFIAMVYEAASTLFPHEQIGEPEIRVSHQIKGRIPEAIGKPAKDLMDYEKTIYYERMAFTINIPTITEIVNGNVLTLSVGGVRAYNHENLYSKKSMEKFKVFIGFQNSVCTNMCISTDGYKEELKASSLIQLKENILQLYSGYDAVNHTKQLQAFTEHELTESQFAHFIGKARMYQYLPKDQKVCIPPMQLNDGQISAVAKGYYDDPHFSVSGTGSISLWNMYNLFTGASKSSYIDGFLDRTVNAYEITGTIEKALINKGLGHWFLH